MAPVIVRRTRGGTLSALLNFALALASGVVLIGNEWVSATPSAGWVVVGGLFVLWATLILSALLRPVLAVADDRGLALRRLLGWHRFGWDALVWADFDSSARAVIVAARLDGRDRFAALPKKPVAEADLAALQQAVAAMRPGLPARNPQSAKRTDPA
jgi:hypothetical protein